MTGREFRKNRPSVAGRVLDVFRQHKDLKPEGIAELNDAGQKLARVLAEEVAEHLDGIRASATGKGEGHA